MDAVLPVISNAVGLFGVVMVMVAYLLLTVGRWTADLLRYHMFNFLGALFLLFSLFFDWNLPSVVIQIAWMLISLVGMYRVVFRPSGSQ